MNQPASSIPFHDFGGQGPMLHFAHANAYPPGCYRQLIAPFLDRYRVIGIKHRPLWPNSQPHQPKIWQIIADDLIAFLDDQGVQGCIGMGHSMGAVATLFAAIKRPDLFSRLVFIEPVLLPSRLLLWVHLLPLTLRKRFIPLTRVALKRRDTWNSRSEVFDSYRQKRVFSRLSDGALWDFVNYGVEPAGNGKVILSYRKEWEAHIYSTVPKVWELPRRVMHPTLAIRGADSDTLLPEAWQRWQVIQPQATFVQIPDTGHLAPLETPQIVAQAIQNVLNGQCGAAVGAASRLPGTGNRLDRVTSVNDAMATVVAIL